MVLVSHRCSEFLKEQDGAARAAAAEGGALERAREDLAELEREEAALVARLKQADADREALQAEEKVIEAEEKTLDDEERRYWKEYNEYQLELGDVLEENSAVTHQYRLSCRQVRIKQAYSGEVGVVVCQSAVGVRETCTCEQAVGLRGRTCKTLRIPTAQ